MILTPQHVLEAVAHGFQIPISDILGRDRTETITRARQVFVGVCRFFRHSYPEISATMRLNPNGGGQSERFRRWESYAPCERRWWVDYVLARYGIQSIDGLSGALAEKFRQENAA